MKIELTSEQLDALSALDIRRYLGAMSVEIQERNPELAGSDVSARLPLAFAAAQRLGIEDDENMQMFLYHAAANPSFYTKPAFVEWLQRSNETPDGRFRAYMQVVHWNARRKAAEQAEY